MIGDRKSLLLAQPFFQTSNDLPGTLKCEGDGVPKVFSSCHGRDAFKRTRCLIPLSGYYEWQDAQGGKQPWYFTARDGSPLLTAAGLWDEWKDRQTGERLKSCTMIITEPNDFAAEIHDRMPVFLTEQQFAPWLSGEAGAGILKPVPNDYLQRWPVSKRVNSSKADADDATLIEPVELATA